MSEGLATRGFQASSSVPAMVCAELPSRVLPVTVRLAFGVTVPVSIASHCAVERL